MLCGGIEMSNIIGIDLGTTYSAASILDDSGRPVIVHLGGKNILPSVVEFTSKDSYSVGYAAKNMAAASENVVPKEINDEVKRHMGNTDKVYELFGEKHTPVSISALILKKIKEEVEKQHGPVDSAVVTVPANFANEEREATVEAAKLAGLNIQAIINEPTAAAFAYAFLSSKELSGTYAIYDLGGGTFDCSIAKVSGQDVEILTSEGVRALGGKDFDRVLIDLVKRKFHEETGKDLDSKYFNVNQAEETKVLLSERETAPISITTASEGVADFNITRKEFEEAISSLVVQAEMAVESAMHRVDLKKTDINEVILVGGSTRIPAIQRSVSKLFGKEPKIYGNPDESVALGAAIYAAYKSDSSQLNPLQKKAVSKMNLQETTNKFFGTISLARETAGREELQNSIIIRRDEKIPCSVTESFYTIHDNQTAVDCTVTESSSDERDPSFVKEIWKGELELPSGRPSHQEVKVSFSYKEDGRMRCSFLDVESGKETKVDLDVTRKASDKSTVDIEKFKVE